MQLKIHNEAMRIINDRRLHAEIQATANRVEALKNPAFKEAYTAYVNDMTESAKKGQVSQPLQTYLTTPDLLPLADSIRPQYFCQDCEDTGVNVLTNSACHCYIKLLNMILVRESGFDHLESFNEIDFTIFDNPKRMRQIYELAQNWCKNPDKNIFLMIGPPGTGKTYLTKCMASALISNNKQVRLCMVQELARSFNDLQYGRMTFETFNSRYIAPDVLIIDDLGCEPLTDVFLSQFKQLIDVRQNNRRPLIITTNLEPAEINSRYTERILSRLADRRQSILIKFDNQDLRRKGGI